MTLPAYLRRVAVILVITGAAALAPAPVLAKPACQKICTVAFSAGPSERAWRSPQRFGNVEVEIAVIEGLADGGRLHRTLRNGGCRGIYRAPGLLVRIEVCGKGPVPIRVFYRASAPERLFTVSYMGR